MTRRAPRCDAAFQLLRGETRRPDRERLLLAAWHSCAQLALRPGGTLGSRLAQLGAELSENGAQPSAGFRPQKKFNDLGLDNGFQTLGWKE